MAITRITSSSFADNSISSDKIVDGGVTADKILLNATDVFSVPSGNTDQRPVSPSAGTIRFNSELSQFEVFGGSTWSQI